MARLIAHFHRPDTQRLGRDVLLAPLQFLPEVAAQLAEYGPRRDPRPWLANVGRGIGEAGPPGRNPERPYTDLAYW